jgi:hypothetical protein
MTAVIKDPQEMAQDIMNALLGIPAEQRQFDRHYTIEYKNGQKELREGLAWKALDELFRSYGWEDGSYTWQMGVRYQLLLFPPNAVSGVIFDLKNFIRAFARGDNNDT